MYIASKTNVGILDDYSELSRGMIYISDYYATRKPYYLKRLQIKVEYGQLHAMAAACGLRALGILLANSAKLFRAPEGRRIVAGGGAQRSHRDRPKGIFRAPEGRRTRIRDRNNPGPAPFQGA